MASHVGADGRYALSGADGRYVLSGADGRYGLAGVYGSYALVCAYGRYAPDYKPVSSPLVCWLVGSCNTSDHQRKPRRM